MKVVRVKAKRATEEELGIVPKNPTLHDHIIEIQEWIQVERELYEKACADKEPLLLNLTRARVFFLAMRDVPILLDAAIKLNPLPCGHAADCAPQFTRKGVPICLRCEWIKEHSKKRRKS